MMLGLACSIAGLLVVAQQSPQPATLAGDPKFKAPISLKVKNDPVDDVLKQISKQAGISASTTGTVSDLKLTIFIKDVKAGLVMDRIADVLGCIWEGQDGVEILKMPQDERDRRDKYLAKEDQEIRANAEKKAKQLAQAAANATSLEDFSQRMSAPESGSSNPGVVRAGPMIPYQPITGPTAYALGKEMAGWSSSDWDQFWSGTVAFASVTPEQPAQPAPQQTRNPRRHLPPRPPSRYIFARYDAYGSHTLEIAGPPRGRPNPREEEKQYEKPPGDLANLPFAKEILAWPDMGEAEKDQAFASALAPASPEQRGDPVTMADQLEQLSKRSGVPIVADAYRNQEDAGLRIGGSTADEWLHALEAADNCFVKVKDGVAMVRPGGFWRLRRVEIPERAIAPLAAKRADLTLADYSTFLEALTPAQAASLATDKPPVLGFPVEPIAHVIPAVRFVAALGYVPTSGSAISYDRLSGDARQKYMDAILESMFYEANWSGQGPGPDPNRWGFELRSENVEQNGMAVQGCTLLFGSSNANAVIYRVPLAP